MVSRFRFVTTNARAPRGKFVLHAKALPGNPYDGHTLSGDRRHREARRLGDRACLCLQELSRPRHGQSAPRLHLQKHSVFGSIKCKTASPLRHRRDRTHKDGRPSRPLLSQRPRRQCRQRRSLTCTAAWAKYDFHSNLTASLAGRAIGRDACFDLRAGDDSIFGTNVEVATVDKFANIAWPPACYRGCFAIGLARVTTGDRIEPQASEGLQRATR
jgi:hypothetical protein